MNMLNISNTVYMTAVIDDFDGGFAGKDPAIYYSALADAFLQGASRQWHGKNALHFYGKKIGTYTIRIEGPVPHIDFTFGCPHDVNVYDCAENLEKTWHKILGYKCECYVTIN